MAKSWMGRSARPPPPFTLPALADQHREADQWTPTSIRWRVTYCKFMPVAYTWCAVISVPPGELVIPYIHRQKNASTHLLRRKPAEHRAQLHSRSISVINGAPPTPHHLFLVICSSASCSSLLSVPLSLAAVLIVLKGTAAHLTLLCWRGVSVCFMRTCYPGPSLPKHWDRHSTSSWWERRRERGQRRQRRGGG